MSGEKLTPQEWCDRTGIEIMDPDGWDRRVFDVDWEIPLTRDEFLGKAFLSTCRAWPHPLLDEEQFSWERVRMEYPKAVRLLSTDIDEEIASPLDTADNVVPLLKALDKIVDSPEVIEFVKGAKMMFSLYSAYIDAGFTEAQAMQFLTASLAGKPQ